MTSVPTPIPLTARPGREAAAPDEPSLHGADRRDIRTADTEPDAEAVRGIDFRQAARHACARQPQPGQGHADDGEAARAPTVGERAAHDPQAEVEKAGQREDQGYRPARGREIRLQRADERAERVGAAEAHEGDGKGAGDDEPAMEYPRIGPDSLSAHHSLHAADTRKA